MNKIQRTILTIILFCCAFSMQALHAWPQMSDTTNITRPIESDIYADSLNLIQDDEAMYGALLRFGRKYELQGNYRRAVDYFTKALNLAHTKFTPQREIESLLLMSRSNHAREYYGTAIRQLTQAEDIARDNNLNYQLLAVLDARWQLMERIGDTGSAFKFHKSYIALRDSLNAGSSAQRQNRAQEAHRRQIDSLTNLNRIIPASVTNASRHACNTIFVISTVLLAIALAAVLLMRRKPRRKEGNNILYLSDTAHQLSQQASMLDNQIELLEEGVNSTDPALHKQLAKISDCSTALVRQSENIFFTSQIIEGRLTVNPAKTDIDATLKSLRANALARHLSQVAIDYKSTGKNLVEADSRMVETIFRNLMYAALNMAGESGIELWIETIGHNSTVGILVRGVITSRHMADLMIRNPYQPQTTKESDPVSIDGSLWDDQGVWLGSRLIEANEGRMTIESDQSGTLFSVTLRS